MEIKIYYLLFLKDLDYKVSVFLITHQNFLKELKLYYSYKSNKFK
jgi:hypothetical protein